MPKLPGEILNSLENVYGPVALNFVLTQTPQGGAPDDIKEAWIGVKLPVREGNLGGLAVRYVDLLTGELKNNDSPVPIAGIEAVHALAEAGQEAAAEFWIPYQLGLFTFRAYEGDFQAL
jgi:hypothetical protein